MTTSPSDDEYEPAPQIVELTGEELVVTDEMRARAFWSLRRYASHVYAARCTELLRGFADGLAGYARANPGKAGLVSQAMQTIDPALEDLDEGLAQLGKGYVTSGYAALARGVVFHSELIGRGFEGGLDWVDLGYGLRERPSTGLFVWAERAIEMARRIDHTLAATWTYTRLLTDKPPEGLRPRKFPTGLPPLPHPRGDTHPTDDEVATTGVHVPLAPLGGAPNFLVEGRIVPPVTREARRVVFVDFSAYEYEAEPGDWQLAWADTRYQNGLQPFEDDFLNEDNALPT